MIEADVNEFRTLKHIFDPKCEHGGGFNRSNDAEWCYRWDSTFIEVRNLRSSEVTAFLPVEALIDHNQNKTYTQVISVESGNRNFLVICVEDSNENSELYIFDPLIKITAKIGHSFKAKITNIKVSDSFDINNEEDNNFIYHFVIMSTSNNEIISDLIKLPRRLRNNSIILNKNTWSFYKIKKNYGKISALETCVEENQPVLFVGFDKGRVISYYLDSDELLNTSLEINKEYSISDEQSFICSIIYKNNKLYVVNGSYTEYDYSRSISITMLNLTNEDTQTIDFPETPGKIEVASLSPDELFLYFVYIHKAKTILKIISIEIMREISEIDITQTYFTPATTAVSLRVLGLNVYSNGICCDILYLTKYVGYTDDDCIQNSNLRIPRAQLPEELKSAPSLYTDEQRKSIKTVRKKMNDSKLFIDLLLETMEIDTKYPFETYYDLKDVQNQLFKDDIYNIIGHCIIYYILKDLNCDYNEYAKQWSILPHYLIAINGYWALDHQNIKEAFNYLWNPLIEIDWPEKIIQLLYDQKYYNEACRFIQITKTSITSDVGIELQMKLYLKTSIFDAFLFQRKYNYYESHDGSNLFTLFLNYCFEEEIPNSSLINTIRKFPYNKSEETQLIQYMRKSNKKLCKDFLLMYYIYHGKYIEAIRFHEENKRLGMLVTDIHQEEREALIQNLRLLLPKVQRTMLDIENEEKGSIHNLSFSTIFKQINESPDENEMNIDGDNTKSVESRSNSLSTTDENPIPLSASEIIHNSNQYDQKILLKALKSQMLSNDIIDQQDILVNKEPTIPFSLPPSIPDKNNISYEFSDSDDESLASSEVIHSIYTNSILNNLSPFSIKQNKEIKETNKPAPLISKQANENTRSAKMYYNALKKVINDDDEEDDDDDDSINYYNNKLDKPMEIRKIDEYDIRAKKYYSSSETLKANNKSSVPSVSFYSTNDAGAVATSSGGGMVTSSIITEDHKSTTTIGGTSQLQPSPLSLTEHSEREGQTSYYTTPLTQKSSRKTLKILSN